MMLKNTASHTTIVYSLTFINLMNIIVRPSRIDAYILQWDPKHIMQQKMSLQT